MVVSDPRCRHDAPHADEGCTFTWVKDGDVVRCACLATQPQHDAPWLGEAPL